MSAAQIGQTNLSEACAAHIPIIDFAVTDAPSSCGLAAVVQGNADNIAGGRDMAIWTIADSNGKANVTFVYPPGITSGVALEKGFHDELTAHCPGCVYTPLSIAANTIGTPALAQQIAGFVRSHPDLQYLGFEYNGVERGVLAALKAAGITTMPAFVGQNPSAASLTDTKEVGKGAWVASPQIEKLWRVVDVIARILVGVPTTESENATFGTWYLTPSTAPDYVYKGGFFPLVIDYKQQYLKLWGVS
jgi:ribose transport system substrate-binding protein